MINVEKLAVGKLKANCYIVYKKGSNEAIVIDPGDEYSKIEEALCENGLYAKAILLTHGHFDHIGALSYFAGQKLPIYININDADKLTTDNNLGKQFGFYVEMCSANMLISADECDLKICDTDVKMIHTPGHSKGSSCFLIENYLFTGDTIFLHNYGRTDLYDGSFEELKNSLRKLKKYLTKDINVMPGHDD